MISHLLKNIIFLLTEQLKKSIKEKKMNQILENNEEQSSINK